MGEMKGEVKMANPFYLKGLATSDGRDEALFDNRSLFINNARLIFNNAALFALR